MESRLAEMLARFYPDADAIEVVGFEPIPGGFSRETFRFDAVIRTGGQDERVPLILRKDPPETVAILQTSRQVEHDLIEAIRSNTGVPVTRSFGAEMDPSVFGEPAMIIGRAPGSGLTSDLFNDGPDADQADDVIRHLCEMLAELHQTEIGAINPGDALSDPRGVGIDVSSWDSYMDTTFEYFISSYEGLSYDPNLMMLLDAFLTLRRNKPRPMPLSLVHGDFNPANFLYADSKVTALIDWENSRVGDPREDLGWMMMMDLLSNTSVMSHPTDKGGFLAYYNELTGLDISMEELGYFTLFGTANIAVPINQAIGRRLRKEHRELLPLYLLQPSTAALPGMCQLLGYPEVSA
ncbi:MAG: phosphotransferase family protein [Actinomycetota bacterium]|nr:phosphotransferase family protein [Actinomycetota bacterium]